MMLLFIYPRRNIIDHSFLVSKLFYVTCIHLNDGISVPFNITNKNESTFERDFFKNNFNKLEFVELTEPIKHLPPNTRPFDNVTCSISGNMDNCR